MCVIRLQTSLQKFKMSNWPVKTAIWDRQATIFEYFDVVFPYPALIWMLFRLQSTLARFGPRGQPCRPDYSKSRLQRYSRLCDSCADYIEGTELLHECSTRILDAARTPVAAMLSNKAVGSIAAIKLNVSESALLVKVKGSGFGLSGLGLGFWG
jgi:hypothetical protein